MKSLLLLPASLPSFTSLSLSLSLSLFGPSSASLPLDGMTVPRYIYFWSVLPSLAFSMFLLSSKLYTEKASEGAVTGLV